MPAKRSTTSTTRRAATTSRRPATAGRRQATSGARVPSPTPSPDGHTRTLTSQPWLHQREVELQEFGTVRQFPIGIRVDGWAIVLVVIIGATALRVSNELSPTRQQQLDASSYPIGAADWLAAHPAVGTRMYNQYGWGGYLAYRFYPQKNRRVFIFGEAALMGDPLLNEYEDVQTLRPDWKQILDRYQVDYIMLPMRDGIRLATVVFRPRAEGRYPTLLVRSPYAAAIPDQFKPVHTAQFKKNYVLVMQNERGSEWSEGDFGILTATTADGQDTLDWISAQEWSNGKVGLAGCSSRTS